MAYKEVKNYGGWETKNLEKLCDLVRGTEPGSNAYFNEQKGDCIRFIRIGDLTGKIDNPKFVNNKLSDLTIVSPDEILISFDGTPGVVVKGWSGAISSGIRVIRNIKAEILGNFLFYYLQITNVQNVIKFYTTGVTILHASRAIPHIEISLPSLHIQHLIVSRLDAIRYAQELNDKQIALAEELFQSLLHEEMVAKAKRWEMNILGDIIDNLLNGFASRPVSEKDGFPQFRPHNIGLDGTLVYEGVKFVPKKIKGIENYLLKKDDIIFNNTNSIELVGKTAFVDKDYQAVFSNHLTRIRVKPHKVSAYYLATLLHLLYGKRKFQTLCTPWVNQAAVNNTALKQLKIPLPPLETQRQIVAKVQAVQDYKKKLLEQKQKLQELFESCLKIVTATIFL